MSERHLASYVEESARRFPSRLAVAGPGGELTYASLVDRASRIAAFLRGRGVVAGDRVGVIVPKSVDAVTVLLGIMMAGAAYVPADFRAPAARLRSIIETCGIEHAVVACETLHALREEAQLDVAWIVVGEERVDGATRVVDALETAPLHAEATTRSVEQLAYILNTSGSTGIPKGVAISHESALAFVDWCSARFEPTENDRFSSHAPFHFDLSIFDLWVALKHGASVHLIDELTAQTGKALVRFVEERQISIWYSTPSVLRMMLDFGKLERALAPTLRILCFAGEVFPIRQLRRVTEVWKHVAFYNLYGPTETNVCTAFRVQLPIPENAVDPCPIGFVCAPAEALVLDDEKRELTAGHEGFLHISGSHVFRGYFNRPDLDASVFHEHEGRRWYNTGDVVRWGGERSGFVYVGRRDRMVKRRGYRIELDEIEKGLHKNGSVHEAAVVPRSDDDGLKIWAFVTFGSATPLTIIELNQHCALHLPSYMSPDRIVIRPALPKTSTDKTDYQALIQLARAG